MNRDRLAIVPSDPPRDSPWRAEGLFSSHFLEQRLVSPPSTSLADTDASGDLFDKARQLLLDNLFGLRKGNEEDCERRLITPLLNLLGFAYSNRKTMPDALQRLLPDYLLYSSQEDAETAFQEGSPAAYYGACTALLEAKRYGHNLSEEASGRGKAPKGRSPHYQIRDYLSESDMLVWGVLTNGAQWRLYCKRDRASSFFEFDLERVLLHGETAEDESSARDYFRVFHSLFRVESFARRADGSCQLDEIRDGSQRFKAEVERDLRVQVFHCVEILGQGFLSNARNKVNADNLSEVYAGALILLYRILFVLNAEARDLLPTRPITDRSRTYYSSYGIELIRRKLANPETAREYADDQTFQLFARLQSLFGLIDGRVDPDSDIDKNAELDIPRYNGGLFDPEKHAVLSGMRIGDKYLSKVLMLLCYRTNNGAPPVAFDYAGLGERHLGSIYEGLLEYHFRLSNRRLDLINDKGDRKTQGAYYTPEAWVTYIVDETMQALLKRIDSAVCGYTEQQIEPDNSFANAVLKTKVCDPAMGSGHFLVEATSVLAEAIAAHPTTAPRAELNADGTERLKTDGSGEPLYTQEAKLAYWMRRVVESCIYGVDTNPLAVELAKLSLWLKTVDRAPLNFLDHHLRCGNSLVGTSLAALSSFPSPNSAAKQRKQGSSQLSLTFSDDLREAVKMSVSDILAIESVATDTRSAGKEKERLWREVSETLMPRFRTIGDLWISAWFGGTITWLEYNTALDDPEKAARARSEQEPLLAGVLPFHWELEFPDIFFDEHGNQKIDCGFDAVIGNPPWERVKLQENEFFAARSAAIAHAPKASDRKRLIAALAVEEPVLWAEYEAARNRAENTLAFAHRSGLYPLMGRGDTNLYTLFAEKALQLVRSDGRIGLLVPSGIATDETTKSYFQHLVRAQRLAQLLDFENREGVFPDVDRRFKFSILLVAGPVDPQPETRCGFFLHDIGDLKDAERCFTLTPEDFALFNPNTLTCPIFRRLRDSEITRRIYENVPVLIDSSKGAAPGEPGNPWNITFRTMFHMTNDSGLFKTARELEKGGFWRGVGNIYTKGAVKYAPLYEGKMVQLYDHRAAGITVNSRNLHRPAQASPTDPDRYSDPQYSPTPQFWVDQVLVAEALNGRLPAWLLGYKDVTSPTNARTMIPCAIPLSGVGNTFCLIDFRPTELGACLLANLGSFVLDYAARQKVGGQHLNFFIVEQLPILPPGRYSESWHGASLQTLITQRVLELCYTAHDMSGFAEAMGYIGPPFGWDEERRPHLRCQLDALFFLLYRLTREEADEILETFPIIKRQDEARHSGRYRTKELVLGYMNAYSAGNMDAWVA